MSSPRGNRSIEYALADAAADPSWMKGKSGLDVLTRVVHGVYAKGPDVGADFSEVLDRKVRDRVWVELEPIWQAAQTDAGGAR